MTQDERSSQRLITKLANLFVASISTFPYFSSVQQNGFDYGMKCNHLVLDRIYAPNTLFPVLDF